MAAEQGDSKQNWPYEKRNIAGGLIHGTFLQLGLAFSQETTVLSAFAHALTGSNFLVGSILSLKRLGMIIPQLFVANFLQTKTFKRPYLILAIYIRSAAWFVLGFATFFLASRHPSLAIFLLILLLAVFFLAGGLGEVVYSYLIARTIAPTHRGKFFGFRYLLGGGAGILAGILAQYFFLNRHAAQLFPRNYGSLFILTAASLGLAGFGFLLMREPGDHQLASYTPFYLYFKGAFSLVKRLASFRRFIYATMLLSGIYLALPFFVVFAQTRLAVPASHLGYYISFQVFGETFSGLVWGWLGDKYGNRLALAGVSVANLLAPLWAVFSGQFWPAGFGLTFAIAGIGFRGADVVIR
ncbi:MAG: hypothetical protein D6814_12200, partial [Calditrichaeota bacterium]